MLDEVRVPRDMWDSITKELREIAAFTKDGEIEPSEMEWPEEDREPFDMPCDDAVLTVHHCIDTARELVASLERLETPTGEAVGPSNDSDEGEVPSD